MTLFFGCLDIETGVLDFVNAGHNAPMLVMGGEMRELEATGIPLAVLPQFPFGAGRTELRPGELLAVFSDGIPEAARGEEFFDNERLANALKARASADRLADVGDGVLAEVETFLSGTPWSDDVTLVLLRRIAR